MSKEICQVIKHLEVYVRLSSVAPLIQANYVKLLLSSTEKCSIRSPHTIA